MPCQGKIFTKSDHNKFASNLYTKCWVNQINSMLHWNWFGWLKKHYSPPQIKSILLHVCMQ